MKYFTFEELTRSATARRMGIDNTPDGEATENLRILTERLLDPLRELWGAPLIVTSGYRCAALNRAVGGVVSSHHLRGMAADIVPVAVTGNELCRLIEVLVASGLQWTQAIMERNLRSGSRWLHLSLNPDDLRMEIKTLFSRN